MAVLLLSHHALNVRWYQRLAKGRWSLPGITQTVVNFALLLMMPGLIASGIILSRTVLSFLLSPRNRHIHDTENNSRIF